MELGIFRSMKMGNSQLDFQFEELCKDPLYKAVIQNEHFQRLFYIPFMGGLSYIQNSDINTNSRGHHSISVALFAYYYAKRKKLPKNTERLTVVSALLHDISHLPFSHTLDFAMKRQRSFSHDAETIHLIGKRSNNKESIEDILSKFNLSKEELSKTKRSSIFRLTHNIDTLDGIYRAYDFFKACTKQKESLQLEIINALLCTDTNMSIDQYNHYLNLWDDFWELKNDVYSNNIYDYKKVIFERILSYYLFDLCEKNNLSDNLLLYSDRDFLFWFPDLRSKIKELWSYIDTESNLDNANDIYHGSKKMKLLLITRRFHIDRKTRGIRFKQLSSLNRRYRIYANKTIVTINNYFVSNITDILSYSLFPKRFDQIATRADSYLL